MLQKQLLVQRIAEVQPIPSRQHLDVLGVLRGLAGLHQTYIGLLERGARTPSLDTANAIARSLGFPLSQLIRDAEKIR
ncbi:MAG: helix-turn-helix transcriptional regulator [Verrucomicrobiae bacterium]|nr:helix-turn-helix transcriptional regulator [Verrucomicrobiae bacterium]